MGPWMVPTQGYAPRPPALQAGASTKLAWLARVEVRVRLELTLTGICSPPRDHSATSPLIFGALGGSRTPNIRNLNPAPLPIGLLAHELVCDQLNEKSGICSVG